MIRLAVRVRRADAEIVLAELLDVAPGGVEERDLGEVVEYALYGTAGELPALPALRAAAGRALVEVATEEVADDWAERWRVFHRPVTVARQLRVRPPWAEPAPPGIHDVVVDPAQAFGTGAHATTRLCLELLVALADRGGGAGALVDVGCGSGVLAIAAAKLGWGPVVAIDHDTAAIRATVANAEASGVEVQARRHDLLRDGPSPSAPTVVANLLRPLLLRVAAEGFAGHPPPQALVAGGLLIEEADEVAGAFAPLGLRERARRADGPWAVLLLAADADSGAEAA